MSSNIPLMDLHHPIRSCRIISLRYVCFISFFVLLSFFFSGAYEIHGNLTDRRALLEFKSKLDDPLGSLGSWNSSSHFCRWSGVTCGRKHQRVTVLDLRPSKLAGIISPYIGNLSFLRILNLRNNTFHSGIPPEVGRLFRLQELYLNNNSLGGQIPPSLSRCSNLVTIRLGHNMLEGHLPPDLGSLSKLQWLSFEYNNLTGEIPPSYENLSSVENFNVGHNNLGGMIPESIGRMRNIVVLDLGWNNFTGPIPSSIFNISSLTRFYIGQNHLVGSLPQDLGHKLPNIRILSVYDNHFTGPIPSSISNASDLVYLDISHNNFTGRVPSFQKMRWLRWFQITKNNLGYQSAGDLNFLCSLANSTALGFVEAGNNRFGGRIPACIGHLSTTITIILLGGNNISGMLPRSIGNLINLNVLELWGNNFSGVIPPEIGNLTKLNRLYLYENEFSGEIPESLGNLMALNLLSLYSNNLRGTIPSSLGNCQQLLGLDLSDNQLDGAIPPEVIGFSSLSILLQLSQNYFSGKIPEVVGKLQNLGILDISGNRLSGEIPSSLGDCVVLERLYMEDNLLEGRIPSTLRSLKGIQELNLSNNKFSGQIAEFFQDLPLTSLDLSHNDFNGALPTKGVFRNANAISLQGNMKLCGGIPEFHLPRCENKRRKNLVRKKIVIWSISGLLGVTLLVIFAFIYRCKRQRKEHVPDEPTERKEDVFPKVSYQSLLKATNGFSSDNLIGVGSFGSVFRGVLDIYEQPVAVKVLNLGSHGASKSFVAECEALRNIRHRNLVKVLTACSGTDYRGDDFKALVYEFMANGSLDEWLHPAIAKNDGETEEEEAPRRLGLVRRLDIAIDVAYALEYLHNQCEQPMVHCDLKPSNVLLDDDMTGHVGDFGLVRFVREATPEVITEVTSSIGVKGSLGYIAPEYGAGGEISTFGDIYSYGILVLEIFTGKRPTDDMFTDGLTLHSLCEAALPENVLQVVDPSLIQELQGLHSSVTNARIRGGFIKIQEESLASIFEVGVKCASELPWERMSLPKIVSALEAIKKKLLG